MFSLCLVACEPQQPVVAVVVGGPIGFVLLLAEHTSPNKFDPYCGPRAFATLDMLIGWSRSCLCLAVLIHLARSNFNHNCTNSTCEDVTKPTDHLRLERIKRAATAQCSASSNDLAHSLVDQICCDATLPLFVDNQLSTNDGMGAISRAVQTRMQARFNTSFEVIISETDFVVNTYYSGPRQCKFETNRYFVAVYETPVQYDIGNLQAEYRLASVDSRDPLGWKQAPFAETSEEISAVDESAQVEPQQLPPPVVPAEPAAGPSPPRTSASGTTGGASRPRRPFSPSASCSARSQTGALPYAFSSNECCDGTLRNIMLNAASRSIATPHLGDAAKYIQRRIQLQYGQSYEVIISRENFAVSTHYHGTSSCKIRSGSYYFLAYSTPVQYDPFNIAQEDLLASTDSEEPLGSTRYTNLRGDLPDVRVEPAAGDDLSIQPSPEQARAAIFEGAGGPARTARQRRPVSMDTEEDTGDERTLTVLDGFHVGGNRSLGHVTSRDEQDFPPGSHCDRDNRSGNMCCDSKLFQTITDAFYDLSSSPQFAFGRAGNIASLIQKRIQQRFSQSFEVFVSSDDFAMASYYKGDQICKYQERGFTVMAYATTVQYDTTNTAAESFYSSISYRDPLGATEPSLPGMRAAHTPLALYGEGGRAGFPVGSHCGESRAGSKCCNLPLFNVMTTSYESVINRPDFDPYDTRLLARTIQWNAEEMLGMSLEVVISSDDFAFSTSYGGDAVCKYRIDRYHIMAYASPVQYPIHTDFYEDSGPAEPLNCPNDLKALSGAVCCDGILQYEMTRLIDQTVANQPADQRDQQSIARAIQRNIQRRFGTTFESIAAKSDFVWSTNLYNENTCKLNAGGYHLLTVESSKEPPPIEDFIDAVPVHSYYT
ncbi:hypothetical protein Q1695_000241 [Nippostrongylus brasiliensis]|nr:hypothetical protein Q1695_000241 [Nippostrongylus brasiliensis]